MKNKKLTIECEACKVGVCLEDHAVTKLENCRHNVIASTCTRCQIRRRICDHEQCDRVDIPECIQSKHSPAPFIQSHLHILDASGRAIASVEWNPNGEADEIRLPEALANAALIERAVASHEEIMTVLKQALSYIEDVQLDFDLVDNGIKAELQRVLAKAEGKL